MRKDAIEGIIPFEAQRPEEKSLVDGKKGKGQKTGRQTRIEEVVSLVHAGRMSGKGREEDADQAAKQEGDQDAGSKRIMVITWEERLTHNRRQRAGEKGQVDVLAERFFLDY